MIFALKQYKNKNSFYLQTNNPAEEMFRKKYKTSFLETCGPSAAVNILAARGGNVNVRCPGKYKPQPEEVLADYFNDPANYAKFKLIRPKIDPTKFMNNRVPQFCPIAIEEVFNTRAVFEWKKLEGIEKLLFDNIGILVCLKKPSHYIGIVAYNTITDKVCYRDSWPKNYWPRSLKGTSGFNRWYDRKLLLQNLENWRVIIG